MNGRQAILPATGMRIDRVTDGWPEKDTFAAQRPPASAPRCERCDHFLPRALEALVNSRNYEDAENTPEYLELVDEIRQVVE